MLRIVPTTIRMRLIFSGAAAGCALPDMSLVLIRNLSRNREQP